MVAPTGGMGDFVDEQELHFLQIRARNLKFIHQNSLRFLIASALGASQPRLSAGHHPHGPFASHVPIRVEGVSDLFEKFLYPHQCFSPFMLFRIPE